MWLYVDFCIQQSKDAGIRTLVMLDEQGGNDSDLFLFHMSLQTHFPYVISCDHSKIQCIPEVTEQVGVFFFFYDFN